MSDIHKLLRDARDWIDSTGVNPKYLLDKLDAAIAEHESEPEHKCGTCRHFSDGYCHNLEINIGLNSWREVKIYDWFCADWQRRETT